MTDAVEAARRIVEEVDAARARGRETFWQDDAVTVARASRASEVFKVRINEGAVQDFRAGTGKYQYAALSAVLADDDLLPLPIAEADAISVDIWCERLLPDYGPYHYLIWEDQCGRIAVVTAVALPMRRRSIP